MISGDAHSTGLRQRVVLLVLQFVERFVIPALPRGAVRHRLRESIDRAQARLHSRVHGGDHRQP